MSGDLARLRSGATGLVTLTCAIAAVVWAFMIDSPPPRSVTLNNIPSAGAAQAGKATVRLYTAADGSLRINDESMDRSQAYWRLASFAAQGQPSLILSYDSRTTALDISRMIDLASQTGFNSVYLEADTGTPDSSRVE